MSGDRERVLEGIRAALRERGRAPHPGAGPHAGDDLIERPAAAATETDRLQPAEAGTVTDPLRRPAEADGGAGAAFAAAFRRVDGEVVELAPGPDAVSWLAAFGSAFASMACAPDVPAELRPDLPEVAPDRAELGVSVALGAAADTGSVLLASTGGRGVQVLPAVHLVWIDRNAVFATLGEALEAWRRDAGPTLPSAVALHTGPSRSADIGQIVVRGVHGAGRIVAALLSRRTSNGGGDQV